MPKLGFDMAEGTLVRWVIQEGEPVEKGAVLAEIETDKATVEVESNYTGVVARHLAQAGEIVPINAPIAIIAQPGEKVEEAAGEKPAARAEKGAEKGEQEKEIPKATEPKTQAPAAPASAETQDLPQGARLPRGVRASPLARRMAEETGIDLVKVDGSGPGGRVLKKDIKEYLMAPAKVAEKSPSAPVAPAARPVETPPKPAKPLVPLAPLPLDATPADRTVPITRLRGAIGRRMTESKQQVPHFYVTHEYDVDMLMSLRKQVNEMIPEEEKISVNDFVVKAVALALRQFPNLNASLREGQIIHHGAINIGVAVAVEGGLLTVVCRDADRKLLRQIAVEVRSMAGRAREGKVRPDDIEGSTFSLSNMGMYDVENFAAIINPPEAGILAVSSARQIPVVKDGQIVAAWRMKATISVDHRVSDGVEAARFMQALVPYLEAPLRLLL
jgi:pyruvate dehydrogenase E2 component (dihydrolipoamide acetyltransferase)